jgi:uncharacterized protein (DUF1684 family)
MKQTERQQTFFFFWLFIAIITLLFTGCGKAGSSVDIQAHKKEIEDWQQKRFTRLKGDQGWLTLCGLFWLKEGENTFGTDSSNSIIFPPGKTPKVAGSLWLDHGVVRLIAQPGAEIKLNDSLVTSMIVISDEDGYSDPTLLSIGTLTIQVIKRSGQYGVRVKDRQNPPLLNFKGMEYFPIDPKWRFEAKFEPYNPPKIIPIATVINTVENDSCPGAIVFDVDGKTYRLDAVMERGTDDQLFIMFSDETSGKETYGLGRQLYTDLPKDNKVVIDFNKAYNWPCVFTTFATCPIPPRQNRLAIRVEAGEKMYAGH